MSLSNITRKKAKKTRLDLEWHKDLTKLWLDRLFPPLEQIIGTKQHKDRSSAGEFLGFNMGEKGSAKTELTNWIIENGIKRYGEENVSVYVTKDLFAVIGVYIGQRQQHFGDILDDKPIQIVVHDDLLSQFGSDCTKEVRRLFAQTFHNTRHFIKHKDENGNKTGRIIWVFNAQDWYIIDINSRRNAHAVVYKSLPYNLNSVRLFRSEHPRQAYEILDDITEKLPLQLKDQAYKGTSYIKLGRKTCGIVKSTLTEENYCLEGGKYWVPSTDLKMLLERADLAWQNQQFKTNEPEATVTPLAITEKLEKGDIYFKTIYARPLPMEFLAEAFNYGYENPYPRKDKAKYKRSIHWQPTFDYLVKLKPASVIASELGISENNIWNDYESRGFIQIVRREQLGHWCETIIPKFDKELKWQVIAGQFNSDLKNQEAIDAGVPGLGLHGEIKTREQKITPSLKDLSTEGKTHVRAGGLTYFYQIIIRRNRGKSAHEIIKYQIFLNK